MSQAPEGWKPLDLVRWTTEFFQRQGIPTARLDAEVLLAHVLATDRLQLYLGFEQPVGEKERGLYRELVRRRGRERVPVAYLTGVREFWSQPFAVTSETLIPRPDSELLVQAAVELRPRRFADVGTGCAAIAAAVALELPEARGTALDRSAGALAVARSNLQALGLAERVQLVCADGIACLRGSFDLIASNPPYIPTGELETLPPEVRHEPRLALDGGEDGLAFVRTLVSEAPARLARPGWLLLEVGAGQAAQVEQLVRGTGAARVSIRKDLAGIERVVVAAYEGAS